MDGGPWSYAQTKVQFKILYKILLPRLKELSRPPSIRVKTPKRLKPFPVKETFRTNPTGLQVKPLLLLWIVKGLFNQLIKGQEHQF
jgi:hypothetical protein